MFLSSQFRRIIGGASAVAFGASVFAAAAILAPSAASAVDQQIVVTQTTAFFGRGTLIRNYRITNAAGAPLSGVTLTGASGPSSNGGSPFCNTTASDSQGNASYFLTPIRTCTFTTAYTGTYSPFTGPGPNSVAWPISMPADAPTLLTVTPGIPSRAVFSTSSGDAVVTSKTDIVTYASPTNTPYVLRAEFPVLSRQADITLSVDSAPAGFDAVVDYLDASGAVVGGAHCVGLPCVNTPFAAPAGATKLVMFLKAAGPLTINGGAVDWWGSAVPPSFSGAPILPSTTTTSSTSTTSTTTTTVAGAIDVSNQFFSGPVTRSGGVTYIAPLGVWYVVVPTAPNRTYADFEVLCDGEPTVTIANLAATVGGNQACTSNSLGVHTVAVRDRLGQYPAVTVLWLRSLSPLQERAPQGLDFVINAPAGATSVTLNGQPCNATVCVLPGEAVVVSAGNPTRPFVDAYVRYLLNGVPGAVTYYVQPFAVENTTSTVPPTTFSPTTLPPSTVPAGLRFAAPSDVVLGQPFSVSVSGAGASSGRVDLSIGGIPVGSQTVDANGSATFTVAAWLLGSTTINADWVRYSGGVAQSTKAVAPLHVRASGATTVPPTTLLPTTMPPTTMPPTTMPPTTVPTTIAPTVPSTGPTTKPVTTVVTTKPTTTKPTTTKPTTTAPTTVPTGGLKLSAPASVRIGTSFTVRITGATPPAGRIDLRIGNQSVGSYLIDGSGSVTATVTPWVFATSITADWVRYENGVPVTVTVSIPIIVSR